MVIPQFVRRAAVRVVAGGLICAVLVAIAGLLGARARFGANPDDTRQRIETDVRQQFADLAARLETAVRRVEREPALQVALATNDGAARLTLFERAAEAEEVSGVPDIAITVYNPETRPVAWSGRPESTPIPRLTGPAALFLAPSAMGLRLIRIEPLVDPAAPDHRVATIVAEAPLTRAAPVGQSASNFMLPTSVVPVPLRARFEGGDASTSAILIRTPSGEPLAAVDVPTSEVAAARVRWWDGVLAAEGVVLVAVLLLLTGPLLDWRRHLRRVNVHVALTGAILALLLAARAMAWLAVRLAQLDAPALASPHVARPFWVALASPLDFLFTVLLVGAIVALVASSFEQWRQGRRARVRVVPEGGFGRLAAFVAAHMAAGAVVGAVVVGYEAFLRTRLSQASIDILHFSLHPWDPNRLAVVIGLVVLHATLVGFCVLVFRMAATPWVVALDHRWLRAWIPALWAAPAVIVILSTATRSDPSPLVPSVLIVTFAIAVAWRLRRFRARLENASQAARLISFFMALALPSIVLYPSLVDAAGRARQQLFETRYAPEVINQRRNLQLQLQEALAQIDRMEDLPALVSAIEAAAEGPPSTDAAFLVWSRTVMADRQLTSSVELHDAAGALVSRFAFDLPDTTAPPAQEGSCDWEIFGEVSSFFSEERRLLHAGRGICVPGTDGRSAMVGSIVVHVRLDYSNLSFITAQDPYVSLLRGSGGVHAERAPREAVEFTVYGWSRRPLYMSGRDAWPLTGPVFERIYASRDPFWAEIERGDTTYEVYFLNDRSSIYALGYPQPNTIGHLISMAELLVLAMVTFVLLFSAGGVYGLIAARTPTSGRALLREVRASFYRKLFIAFVAAAVVPVIVLAFLTRTYIAGLMSADLEMEASRTAASASRVVEDVGTIEARGGSTLQVVDDNLIVWLSRIIAQDVNVFDDAGLLASSERNLYASGLLSTRTPGHVYRAIVLDGRPSYVGRERIAGSEYLVAAAPVRVQNRDAILTVPLTLREQQIETQADELDRRLLLAVVLFIGLGAGIGYSMAERIADPVNRLMKATGRIARGDFDARILETSSDEFRRLVREFNRMAADLQRQRVELERTNRLAAWADMARQVAHDIKNPLTPIQLNAEHLRRVHEDRGAPLGAMVDQCVHNILTQVRLLRQIAGEFSSFASSPTPRPVPAALGSLVAEVIEPYRMGLVDQVTIVTEVPSSLPPVLVDKTLLARALTNIIENALHAMPGGGTLRLEASHASDGHVRLAISDTGVGMDRASLQRIFEPYFSTRASGTGLGLTIAKRNVELNNGSIAVESERGHGTTVFVTLPVAV